LRSSRPGLGPRWEKTLRLIALEKSGLEKKKTSNDNAVDWKKMKGGVSGEKPRQKSNAKRVKVKKGAEKGGEKPLSAVQRPRKPKKRRARGTYT